MVEGQMGLNWERWQRVLTTAETAGYQCVFRSDHFTNPAPPDRDSLELFTSLTYAAIQTRRIEFGSLVAPVTFRHPTMTVRQAAARRPVKGRLVLGLGAGWQRREHDNYAIPFGSFTSRFETFADALEITQRLLTQDAPVTFAGRQLSVSDAVLLPRPRRRIPILIGGNGEKRTLPLAYADNGWGVSRRGGVQSRNALLTRCRKPDVIAR
jgi:alkanesulfonate monooxygenase SsuD/methylene tetrahydromethanopterin reductase-like flavin-dependent oxidoreductase (luciferase family)